MTMADLYANVSYYPIIHENDLPKSRLIRVTPPLTRFPHILWVLQLGMLVTVPME